MSCQENDKIKEACYEDFVDLFDVSDSFKEAVLVFVHPFESWYEKECDRYDDRFLIEFFERLYRFDCELLCKDKRTCVEAYGMYLNSMKQLNGDQG